MRMRSACARPSAPLGALDGCARDQYARTRRRGAQYGARPGHAASGLQARALAARGPRGTRPAVAWLQRPAHPGTRAAYARVREAPCGGAQRHEESRATPTRIRRSAALPSVAGGRRLGPGLRMTEGARHAAAADVHAVSI